MDLHHWQVTSAKHMTVYMQAQGGCRTIDSRVAIYYLWLKYYRRQDLAIHV